jgi:hypothetical protein
VNEWTDEESDQRCAFRWLTRSRQMRIVVEHAPSHPIRGKPPRRCQHTDPGTSLSGQRISTANTITRAHGLLRVATEPARATLYMAKSGTHATGRWAEIHPSCESPHNFDKGQDFWGLYYYFLDGGKDGRTPGTWFLDKRLDGNMHHYTIACYYCCPYFSQLLSAGTYMHRPDWNLKHDLHAHDMMAARSNAGIRRLSCWLSDSS